MVPKPRVLFLVTFNALFLTLPEVHQDLFFTILDHEGAADGEKACIMPYGQAVPRSEITLAKAQIMYGIKDICLTAAIGSGKGIGTLTEIEFSFAVIFEVE